MNTEFLAYLQISPPDALRPIVEHYRLKSMKTLNPIILTNYSPIFQGLIFNLNELEGLIYNKSLNDSSQSAKVYYVGQAISPSYLSSTSSHLNLIAVNFTTTGLYRLTGIDMYHFTDSIVNAEDIFGKEINELYEQVIEAAESYQAIELINDFLLTKLFHAKSKKQISSLGALNILTNDINNADTQLLCELTGMSKRRLERVFKTEIGITPKVIQRLLRFNIIRDAIENNSSLNWWELVVKYGFYDHPHLINEFKKFSGITPKAYQSLIEANSSLIT